MGWVYLCGRQRWNIGYNSNAKKKAMITLLYSEKSISNGSKEGKEAPEEMSRSRCRGAR
jgi:hypothetical protein